MVSTGSSEEKTKFPATRTSAPASTSLLPVSRFTPPSTSISAWAPFLAISCFKAATFSTECSINRCPPKPGLTDISRTISRSLIISSSSDTGVCGLSVTPAFIPRFCCHLLQQVQDREPERDVGDKNTVHYIEVYPIGFTPIQHFNIFFKMEEIRRQERRCNQMIHVVINFVGQR